MQAAWIFESMIQIRILTWEKWWNSFSNSYNHVVWIDISLLYHLVYTYIDCILSLHRNKSSVMCVWYTMFRRQLTNRQWQDELMKNQVYQSWIIAMRPRSRDLDNFPHLSSCLILAFDYCIICCPNNFLNIIWGLRSARRSGPSSP